MERPSAKHSLHKQSRPSRTPKQHKMLIKRIRKIGRMFKPGDISFPEWFDKIRRRNDSV
jgi:hypothetical protein